jgi:histidyl-tRNA synthetase
MDVHLARGTRDFLPAQMRHRLAVLATLRGVFERFGFEPLETPALERIETLTGKYGDEGDKLFFRILERGEGGREGKADMGLRYDLTVPLARVMAMHPEIRLPFRRYQMQPVWRGERPGRGRFREFWQCDVDIAGTTSPVADAECLAVVAASLEALKLPDYTIKLNDRRILSSLAREAGANDAASEMSVLIAVDKLDKIGRDGVAEELVRRGFGSEGVARLWGALDDAQERGLSAFLGREGRDGEGAATLRDVLAAADALGVSADKIKFDATLARGLDYYTGPVFETVVNEAGVGSVSGGGRYDQLIGMFAGKAIPAVGVTVGIDRLFTVMEERAAQSEFEASPDVLVAQFGAQTLDATLRTARAIRDAGIATEVFTEPVKLANQLKHANARKYRFVVIVGPDEAARGVVTLRRLSTGDQVQVPVEQAIASIRLALPSLA